MPSDDSMGSKMTPFQLMVARTVRSATDNICQSAHSSEPLPKFTGCPCPQWPCVPLNGALFALTQTTGAGVAEWRPLGQQAREAPLWTVAAAPARIATQLPRPWQLCRPHGGPHSKLAQVVPGARTSQQRPAGRRARRTSSQSTVALYVQVATWESHVTRQHLHP